MSYSQLTTSGIQPDGIAYFDNNATLTTLFTNSTNKIIESNGAGGWRLIDTPSANAVSGVSVLTDLDDVGGSPENNQVLTYNSTLEEWNPQPVTLTLNGLSNVSGTPANNQVLTYITASGEWLPTDAPTGSGDNDQIAIWGTNTIAGDANFTWDGNLFYATSTSTSGIAQFTSTSAGAYVLINSKASWDSGINLSAGNDLKWRIRQVYIGGEHDFSIANQAGQGSFSIDSSTGNTSISNGLKLGNTSTMYQGMIRWNSFNYQGYKTGGWVNLDEGVSEEDIDHGAISGLNDDDHTQYLLAAGTRALTADWDAGAYKIRARQLQSDVATGTSPLVIASTTVVTNLNADRLDGNHASAFALSANGVTNGDSHDHSGGDGAQIDHTTLSNKGTNTHSQIDTHISSNHVNSFNTRTGAVTPATNDYTWAQINKTTSDIADITTKSHTSLTDKGTNTHAQIDTHLGAASPHSSHVVIGSNPLDNRLAVWNNTTTIEGDADLTWDGTTLDVAGNALIGGAVDSNRSLSIAANEQYSRYLLFKTGNSIRWAVICNSAAETGGNEGSDFSIARYADNGSYLGNVLHANRETGDIRTYFDLIVDGNLIVNDSYDVASGIQQGSYTNIQGANGTWTTSIQDGNGRVNMYWNAYPTGSDTWSAWKANDRPSRLLIGNTGRFDWYISTATPTVAGESVTWNDAAFSIDNAGNVGINNESPNTKLDVAGNIGTTGDIIIRTSSQGIRTDTSNDNDNQYVRFTGGGGFGDTRGAQVTAFGNEVIGFEGLLSLVAGNDAALGTIRMTTGNTTRVTVEYDGDVTCANALTVGSAASAAAGAIQWDGSNFQGYTGSAWVDLDTQDAVDGSGATNQISYWSDSNTLTGSNNLTYGGTVLTIAGNLAGGGLTLDSSTGVGINMKRPDLSNRACRLRYWTNAIEQWGVEMVISSDTLRIYDVASGVEAMRFTQGITGETVINEAGIGRDFRVESTNDTHLLFVDASHDRIGIGTDNPNSILHVKSQFPTIRLEDTDGGGEYSRILVDGATTLIDADGGNSGASSEIGFNVDNSRKVTIDASGNIAVTGTVDGLDLQTHNHSGANQGGTVSHTDLNNLNSASYTHLTSANHDDLTDGNNTTLHIHDSRYYTESESDLRFAPIAEGVTGGDSHDHNGGDGAQIDHTTLSNKGTNTHTQIDSHISSDHVSSFNTRTGAVTPATNDYTWAQINKTTSNLADIATKSHTSLTDKGTNTHTEIDSHISAASPHTGHPDISGTPLVNQVALWTDSNTLKGDANLTYGGTALTIAGSLGGGGLTLNSTSGAGIYIDRGNTSAACRITYRTNGAAQWKTELVANGTNTFRLYDETTLNAVMNCIQGSEVVFNESSKDLNFRVESDTNEHMLFVDGGTNRVGIGTNSPNGTLDISCPGSDTPGDCDLMLSSNTDVGLFGFRISPSTDSYRYLFLDRNWGGWSNEPAICINRSTGDIGFNTIPGAYAFHLHERGLNSNCIFTMTPDTDTYDSVIYMATTSGNTDGMYLHSDGATDALIIGGRDGGANTQHMRIERISGNVGIGGQPSYPLHIYPSDANETAHGTADELVVESNASTGMSILSGSTSPGTLAFGRDGGSLSGAVRYEHDISTMILRAGGGDRVWINPAGKVGIGATPSDFLEITGALSGGGITVDSSSGANINIDRGTDGNACTFDLRTAGVTQWQFALAAGGGSNDLRLLDPTNSDEVMRFNQGTDIIVNSYYKDRDFRIAASGIDNQNMFFVDGGEARIGIGTNAPAAFMHLETPDSNPNLSTTTNSLRISLDGGNAWEYLNVFKYNKNTSVIQNVAGINTVSNLLLEAVQNGASTKDAFVGINRFTDTTGDAALRVFNADGTDGENCRLGCNVDSFLNVNTGNVGIGTDTPGSILHVYHDTTDTVALFESGDASVAISLADGDTLSTQNNQIRAVGEELRLKAGGTATLFIKNDKVGIGATATTEQLEVEGAIKIGTAAGTGDGTIRWNATNFEGYNGGWVRLDITDHGDLSGKDGDDHPQYLLVADIDTVPTEGATSVPVSSAWVYTHAVTLSDPHPIYRKESEDHSHQSTGLQGGKLDHGLALDGLGDDDHTQYLTEARHDLLAADNPHSVTAAQVNAPALGTRADNQIAIWNGTTTLDGDANLTWDGTTLDIDGGTLSDTNGTELDMLELHSLTSSNDYLKFFFKRTSTGTTTATATPIIGRTVETTDYGFIGFGTDGIGINKDKPVTALHINKLNSGDPCEIILQAPSNGVSAEDYSAISFEMGGGGSDGYLGDDSNRHGIQIVACGPSWNQNTLQREDILFRRWSGVWTDIMLVGRGNGVQIYNDLRIDNKLIVGNTTNTRNLINITTNNGGIQFLNHLDLDEYSQITGNDGSLIISADEGLNTVTSSVKLKVRNLTVIRTEYSGVTIGGDVSPANKLDVDGAVVIGSGSSYAGSATAPTNGLLVEGDVECDDGLLIGTSTIPHGNVGMCKLAIHGTNGNAAGPHVQFTTGTTDDYPLMQIMPWTHDNVQINFDAFFNGTAWRSSDAGSNFQIRKSNDMLRFRYDSGITEGTGTVDWIEGIVLDTNGHVGIGQTFSGIITPKAELHIDKGSENTSAAIQLEHDGGSGGQWTGIGLSTKGDGQLIGGTNQGWRFIAYGDSYTTSLFQNQLQLLYYNGTSNQYAMRFDTSGRVSIGSNTNPSYVLHVRDGTGSNYVTSIENSNNTDGDKALRIICGSNSPTTAGDCKWIGLLDGDGTPLSYIQNVNSSGAQFSNTSDARLKTNITPTAINGLDIVNNLPLRQFDWINKPDSHQDIGFIAQEVQDVYPSMVSYDKENDTYMVADGTLVPVLVKAVQEQQDVIEEQKQKINSLESRLAALETLLIKE